MFAVDSLRMMLVKCFVVCLIHHLTSLSGHRTGLVLGASCGRPRQIPNTVVTLQSNNTSVGSRAIYRCDVGYKKTGGILSFILCLPNRKWTTISMRCDLVTCPALTNPANGEVEIVNGTTGRYEYQSEYKYSCDDRKGFRLKGKQIRETIIRTCTQDGSWSYLQEEPECELIDCGDPGPMYNGYLGPGGTIYGEQRSFRCNARTTMEPEINEPHRTILCLNTGQWSRRLPTCWGKCLVPWSVDHGYHTRSNVLIKHEEETTISCDQRYTTDIRNPTERSKTRQCWNGTLTIASCTEKPCIKLSENNEGLKETEYTSVEIDGIDWQRSKFYTHGTEVRTTCKDTHETSLGNGVVSTQFSCDKGEWSGKSSQICKPKACIIRSSVTTGRPRFTSEWVDYTPGETLPHGRDLDIVCQNRKVLTSTMEEPAITIRCTFGEWSNSTVFTEKCEPDPCEELDKDKQKASDIQYGMIPRTLSDRKRYVRHGTEVNFTCKRGYQVKHNVHSGIVECRTGRYYDQQQEQSQLCKPAGCRIGGDTANKQVVSLTNRGQWIDDRIDRYFDHNKWIKVSCKDKFVFQSSKTNMEVTTRCDFGRWTSTGPLDDRCVEAPCAVNKWTSQDGTNITDSFNVTYKIGDDYYVDHNEEVEVSCESRYVLTRRPYLWDDEERAVDTPSKRVRCYRGTWNQSESRIYCKPRSCTRPVNTDISSFSSPSPSSPVPHGGQVRVVCNPGYEIDDSPGVREKMINCSFGNFPDIPKCRNASCVLSIMNGVFTSHGDHLLHGEKASFQCDDNFLLNTTDDLMKKTDEVTCNKGSWVPPPGCRKVTGECAFPQVINGNWFIDEPLKSVGINCSSSLPPEDGDVIVDCGTNRKWKNVYQNNTFVCQEECSNIEMYKENNRTKSPSESNSRRSSVSTDSLSTCLESCINERNCSSTQYDDITGICVRSTGRMEDTGGNLTYWKMCVCPEVEVNVSSIKVTGQRTIGSRLRLECKDPNKEFAMLGNNYFELVCEQNGEWDLSTEDLICEDRPVRLPESSTMMTSSPTPQPSTAPTRSPSVADCDFENDGTPTSCNWSQSNRGNFNWTRNKGETPTHDTGPTGDHTTKDGYYLYIEASSKTPGYKASLDFHMRNIYTNGSGCLKFYYHMFGQDIGSLYVSCYNKRGGSAGDPLIKHGNHGNNWWLATVDINCGEDETLAIEGVVGGDRGDIAIDDITWSPGFCPERACRPFVKRDMTITGENRQGGEVTVTCKDEGKVINENGKKQIVLKCDDLQWEIPHERLTCVGGEVTTTTTTTTTSETQDCNDINSHCARHTSYCTTTRYKIWQKWMQTNCKKTCGFC